MMGRSLLKHLSLPSQTLSQPESFSYRDNQLFCEEVSLSVIAQSVGTPVYVYSRQSLAERIDTFLRATTTHSPDALICYAVKANANPALLNLFRKAGLGADVTSGGELFLARNAGIDPSKIIFSGVGKREHEITEAITAGIKAIHVESEMELHVVAEIAEKLGRQVPIGVRVNPNIDAETHPYISTGLHGHKFGVPKERAVAMLQFAAAHPALHPVGIAAHIGSQISELGPYAQSVDFLIEVAVEMRDAGLNLTYIDAGGGLGIDYESEAPSIIDWVNTIAPRIHAAGFSLVLEPGRSIVGQAGVLLTRVVYTKEQGDKRFVIVDAGMTDLIRPALYQAYHPIIPVVESREMSIAVDVVGPICESSDILGRDRLLPKPGRQDLLAILHSGAYGFAMSSNYNGHLRPAEVLVEGDSFRVIRRRQEYEDLLD
jgi:diaminopimelate decarboxylase